MMRRLALVALALTGAGCAAPLGAVRPLQGGEGAAGLAVVLQEGRVGFGSWVGVGLGGGWDVVLGADAPFYLYSLARGAPPRELMPPAFAVRKAMGEHIAAGVLVRAPAAPTTADDGKPVLFSRPGLPDVALLLLAYNHGRVGDVGATVLLGYGPSGPALTLEGQGDLAVSRDSTSTGLASFRVGARRPSYRGRVWGLTLEGGTLVRGAGAEAYPPVAD